MLDKMLSVKEAAQLVGLSASQLNKLRCTGGGPVFVKIGGRRVVYAPADLEAWLDGQKRQSTGAGAGK